MSVGKHGIKFSVQKAINGRHNKINKSVFVSEDKNSIGIK